MKTHDPRKLQTRDSGQAMIEFVIALVAIMAVCAGMLQLGSLTKTQTDVLFEARRDAARNMFSPALPAGDPEYIRFWENGPDGKPLTADDTTTRASGSEFASKVVGRAVADPSHWPVIEEAPDDAFLSLQGNAMPAREFGLIGARKSRSVDLLPAVQHLLYAADSLDVEAKVWMTWTRGMY
jgi:hypothetical protein